MLIVVNLQTFRVASYYRANIFLWLVHRFLEDPAVATDFKSSPNISTLEYQLCDPALENVDTEEEIAYGQTAKAARQDVVAKLQQEKAMAGSMSQGARRCSLILRLILSSLMHSRKQLRKARPKHAVHWPQKTRQKAHQLHPQRRALQCQRYR